MKKSLLLFVLAAMSVFCSAQTLCTVTGTHVRLRWNPSLSSPVVTNSSGRPTYPARGARLYCYGHNNGFCKTSYNGYSCWIASQYMNHAGGGYYNNTPRSNRIVVTGTNVRLRTAPSLRAGTLTDGWGRNIHPSRGAILNCYGHSNGFCRTSFNGYSCWISLQFTRHI